MKRYRIRLAYNGKNYFGWQRQPEQISVQEAIEDALTKLNRNQPISIVGCGRTDTGVHAHDYVAHVDLPIEIDTEQYLYKLNKILPADIAIFELTPTTADFHARFDATARTYRYFLHTQKNAFNYDQSLYLNVPLDFEKMNQAAKYLLGKQDFTSLAKLHTDVKTNICTVEKAEWIQVDETSYYFEIKADRFLRNMVRATVGTLLTIGQGKIEPDYMPKILALKDRNAASTSAPGHSLFLWKIEYE